MSWLKNHLPKSRRKHVTLSLLSILLILLAADMLLVQAWHHIDISPETTRITTPLNADGLPDYIAAHNAQASQGITPENNAAPAILQIIGTDRYSDTWRNTVLPYLGLSPAAHPPQFLAYDAWLLARHTEPIKGDAVTMLKTPWTSAENPVRAQWLQSQTPILAKLHEALQKDRFYIPWASDTTTLFFGQAVADQLLWIGGLRECSLILTVDTSRAIGEKDFPAFDRDIADQLKLIHIFAQGSTLIDYIVGCTSQYNTSRALQLAATTPDFLTSEQIQALQQQLDTASLMPDMSRCLDVGERYSLLDSLCFSSLHGLDQLAHSFVNPDGTNPATHPIARLLIPVHFNTALRNVNTAFDQEVIAAKLPTYHQRLQALLTAESDYRSHLSFSNGPLSFLVPTSLTMFLEYQTRAITHLSLCKLALALNAYHTTHNQYPKSLNDLTPTFLPTLPQDEFADAPFHYQPTEKGYTLYSVGPDGQDNHATERNPSATTPYDIVVKANQ